MQLVVNTELILSFIKFESGNPFHWDQRCSLAEFSNKNFQLKYKIEKRFYFPWKANTGSFDLQFQKHLVDPVLKKSACLFLILMNITQETYVI